MPCEKLLRADFPPAREGKNRLPAQLQRMGWGSGTSQGDHMFRFGWESG